MTCKTLTSADIIALEIFVIECLHHSQNLVLRISCDAKSLIVCLMCIMQSYRVFATVFSSVKMPTACEVYRLHTVMPPDSVSATRVSVVQQPCG